jgi:hypothetical protein
MWPCDAIAEGLMILRQIQEKTPVKWAQKLFARHSHAGRFFGMWSGGEAPPSYIFCLAFLATSILLW